MKTYCNLKGEIHIDLVNEDKCYKCKTRKGCPLLNAILQEDVIQRYERIVVEKCAHFKKYNTREILDTIVTRSFLISLFALLILTLLVK